MQEAAFDHAWDISSSANQEDSCIHKFNACGLRFSILGFNATYGGSDSG